MKSIFLKWSAFLMIGVSAFATPIKSVQEKAPVDLTSQEELLKKISQLDERIKTVQGEIRSRAKTLHLTMNAPQMPKFLWSDETDNTNDKQQRLLSLLRIEMRTLLRLVESLEQRKDELNYELEWEKIKTQDFVQKAKLSPAPKDLTPFKCQLSPVSPLGEKALIKQPFGTYKDAETGLEWQTSGWWVTQVQNDVKVCAKGSIVYTGKVAGRGRVVLVDHGNGNMTLYANLSDQVAMPLVRGAIVKAGTSLGTPLEKFYFEVRKDSDPIDPKTVFSEQTLLQFQL